LPQALIRELAADATAAVYLPGETVLKAGDRSAPGVLLEGLLRLYIQSNDGRQATLRYVKPGHIVSVVAPFHPMPGTLVAIAASRIIQFGEGAATRLARTNADFAWELASALADWTMFLTATVANMTFGSVRQRVATHLLELAPADPGVQGLQEIQITQQELADAVGTVREVVSRVLKNLRSLGVIATSYSTIVILDPDRLRQESILNSSR
jgi:CRP/FNR family transcriptional regulator